MIPDEESQPLPDDVIDRGYKLQTPGRLRPRQASSRPGGR